MKISTLNSEKLLLADLREARIGMPTHRCLFLRLSQIDKPTSYKLSILESLIRYVFKDTVDQVYLMHDNDVFITGWGLTRRLVDSFLDNMEQSFGSEGMSRISNLYEIGISWNELEALCMQKLAIAEKDKMARPKIMQPEMPEQTKAGFGKIDYKQVETIQKRRMARREFSILIVEDDLFSQTLVKKALQNDYQIIITDDGHGAIQHYIRDAPDIVFLDIDLPDINGHQILQKLYELDETSYIVMFSGNGDRENVVKAIDYGAQGFVGKPFSKEKLIQYIKQTPTYKGKLEADLVYNEGPQSS
jgi:CheY-like chemotaxis protein